MNLKCEFRCSLFYVFNFFGLYFNPEFIAVFIAVLFYAAMSVFQIQMAGI